MRRGGNRPYVVVSETDLDFFFFYCAGGFTLLSLSLMSGGMKNCDEEPLSSGTSAFEGVVIRGGNVGFAGEMWFWGTLFSYFLLVR